MNCIVICGKQKKRAGLPLGDVGDVKSPGVTPVERGQAGNTVTAYVGGSMEHGLLCSM